MRSELEQHDQVVGAEEALAPLVLLSPAAAALAPVAGSAKQSAPGADEYYEEAFDEEAPAESARGAPSRPASAHAREPARLDAAGVPHASHAPVTARTQHRLQTAEAREAAEHFCP